MVHHQIDDDADAPLGCCMRELDEVPEVAVARVDLVVVRDVIPVVAARRGLKGHQPDRGDPQPLQIVEAAHQSLEVPDAVGVGVHERADGEAVEDSVLVPEIVDHGLSGFMSARG